MNLFFSLGSFDHKRFCGDDRHLRDGTLRHSDEIGHAQADGARLFQGTWSNRVSTTVYPFEPRF